MRRALLTLVVLAVGGLLAACSAPSFGGNPGSQSPVPPSPPQVTQKCHINCVVSSDGVVLDLIRAQRAPRDNRSTVVVVRFQIVNGSSRSIVVDPGQFVLTDSTYLQAVTSDAPHQATAAFTTSVANCRPEKLPCSSRPITILAGQTWQTDFVPFLFPAPDIPTTFYLRYQGGGGVPAEEIHFGTERCRAVANLPCPASEAG